MIWIEPNLPFIEAALGSTRLSWIGHSSPLLATASAENAPIVLSAVLLSLVIVYLASKLGGEVCKAFDFPPVLGELIGGVIVGASAMHLLVFPESGAQATDSLLMPILQWVGGLTPEAVTEVFASQSEIISLLAELGVIILLFEIGLESDLRELQKVGYQAAIVACVGVAVPFAAGTVGLMILYLCASNSCHFCWGSIDSNQYWHYLESAVGTGAAKVAGRTDYCWCGSH